MLVFLLLINRIETRIPHISFQFIEPELYSTCKLSGSPLEHGLSS